MFKWLRRFGALGNQAANFATLVTASWGVILSLLFGGSAAVSDRLSLITRNENVRAGAAVFLFSLWTYIGLSALYQRSKPLLTKRVTDRKFGITFENIHPLYDQDSELALQFVANIRNYSGEALSYRFTKFDVTIVTRHVSINKEHMQENIITFGTARGFYSEPS